MTVIPFPNSGRSIFDDTLAYTIAAAGEIIASRSMRLPIGAVMRDGDIISEFWLSVRDDGKIGLWGAYESGDHRLLDEGVLPEDLSAEDPATTLFRRFRNCIIAFAESAKSARNFTPTGDYHLETRIAPKSRVLEVRAQSGEGEEILGWWQAPNDARATVH